MKSCPAACRARVGLRFLAVLVMGSAFLVHVSAMVETVEDLRKEGYQNTNRVFTEDAGQLRSVLNRKRRPVKNEQRLQAIVVM